MRTTKAEGKFTLGFGKGVMHAFVLLHPSKLLLARVGALIQVHILTSGHRKYGSDGKVLEKWSGEDVDGKRKEKEEASELFKSYWRRCTSDENYVALKQRWQEEKKQHKEE